jgi:hypothetical protein
MKSQLEKELDKNKFFVVNHALTLSLAIIAFVLLLLSILRIEGHSILYLFFRFYLR